MNSKSLEYMIALYKTGSMTRAAKELYVSQSNLSQFLKNEEAELGTKLFTREHGKYVPTEAGKIYIEYATQVQEMTTTFRRIIEAAGSSDRYHIFGRHRNAACDPSGAS